MIENKTPVEIFRVARGYLLRLTAHPQPSDQVQVRLEQLKYNSMRKEFEIVSKDLISQITSNKSTQRTSSNSIRIEFIGTHDNSGSFALVVQQTDSSFNRHAIVVSFDEISRTFRFNSKLTASLNDFFNKMNSSVSILRASDVYVKFSSDCERYVAFVVTRDEASPSRLELCISNETATCKLELISSNDQQIDRFELLKTLELNTHSNSLLNSKLVFFIKVLMLKIKIYFMLRNTDMF